jgi:hypothetical protein
MRSDNTINLITLLMCNGGTCETNKWRRIAFVLLRCYSSPFWAISPPLLAVGASDFLWCDAKNVVAKGN